MTTTVFHGDYGQAADTDYDADHASEAAYALAAEARHDAERDFTAQCERTVAPGTCTGCELHADELLPWTPAERLCHQCVSYQLDLLAKAIAEGDGMAVNVMKARWV